MQVSKLVPCTYNFSSVFNIDVVSPVKFKLAVFLCGMGHHLHEAFVGEDILSADVEGRCSQSGQLQRQLGSDTQL